MKDEVRCPLIDNKIDIGDCLVTSDISEGMFKENNLSDEFKRKKNWREICKSCKYHNN